MEDSAWLLATIAAALCWSLADILCDTCIGESEEDEEDGYEMVRLNGKQSEEDPTLRSIEAGGNENNEHSGKRGPEKTEALVRRIRNAVPVSPPASPNSLEAVVPGGQLLVSSSLKLTDTDKNTDDGADDDDEDDDHLDGTQDCAIAGITTGMAMYFLSIRRLSMHRGVATMHGTTMGGFENSSFKFLWSPLEDLEWSFAAISGTLMFTHYLFLLMAFDSAPSTVINPLIQVSSTWMIFGSAFKALITGTKFITSFDMLCYVIIVIGGILPSLDGNLKAMATLKFWKQRFVRNTVISEVAVGLYDLILSYTLQHSGRKEKFREIAPSDMEFEFFFIAWSSFVIIFCFIFALAPHYRQKFIDLRKIPRKILVLSSVGQVLTLVGYYFSQFAYSWYYQASIVHAAEASLSQAFNLLFAIIAQKLLGYGRESSITNLRIKMISCVVVSVGLFMLGMHESEVDDIDSHVRSVEMLIQDIGDDVDLGP
mmetsp:Transcript_19218/g.31538  ORF Transcript_19218/g.31538 Transcript_19218/m.31538 type:complete len:483 (+) Transcript_19218:323-1771(+)